VGKIQLLVPIALVLATTKVPGLHILPALLGFLLYKPALLVQALLDA
jgi:ATP synthase protein I